MDDVGTNGTGGLVALDDTDRRTARLVAGLIDGEVERRVPPGGPEWLARHLGTPVDGLRLAMFGVSGWEYVVQAWALGQAIERYRPPVAGADGRREPRWRSWPLPDGAVRLPAMLSTVFPAGTLSEDPIACMVEASGDGDSYYLVATSLPGREREAEAVLARLADEALRQPGHPLRCRTLVIDGDHDLEVEARHPVEAGRADLMLADRVWDEIDTNVHGLFRNRGVLERLGLGLNRGVLLSGPPGTGKTHLARVVAAELRDTATILLPTPEVARRHLLELYRVAERLAPTLVVLEDVDLIAGGRHGGGDREALVDLLVAIDGAMTSHSGVVTVATTNDVGALDEAARRAARFDRVIDMDLPDRRGRARIWSRYLRDLEDEFDVDELARVSEGASGADIRELVRRAVLDGDGCVRQRQLVALARKSTFGAAPFAGAYL